MAKNMTVNAAETEIVAEESRPEKKQLKAKAFDPDQIITVRNGFQGRLVFKSKKTGEKFVWDGFGDEQDMEFSELKAARSSSKNYFINNWFMFDDPEVVEQLGVSQYYRFALTVDDFDTLFKKSPSEIAEVISKLSTGQKKSVAYRAKQMIIAEEIDSNKVINALEKSLGVELIER